MNVELKFMCVCAFHMHACVCVHTHVLIINQFCMHCRVAKEKFIKHGEKVVRYVMEHGTGLLEFQKRWRQHFLETMEPHFLPPLWSVDHIQESWDLSSGAAAKEPAYTDHEINSDSGTCRSSDRQDTDDDDSDDDEGELIE